jgi:putative spermidine/putrescine transport system substrate-binding protein
MRKFRTLALGSVMLTLASTWAAQAEEKVVIANYGGLVADFNNKYCAPKLKDMYGITLEQVAISDPLGQLKVQQATGTSLWDMFPAEGEILITASEAGWLEPIDWAVVDPENEMPEIGRHEYGVAGRVYSMILAYRTDKVPEGKTVDGWKTFWDFENFPGPRAMRDSPLENLEFALIADGVPVTDVYTVLSTEEGVERAFKKLDEIKPEISVFWTSGQQPAQLLASGEVYYTNTWNGRIVQMKKENLPVEISWNGGSLNIPFYSIPKGAKNAANVMKYFNACFMDMEIQEIGVQVTGYPSLSPKLAARLPQDILGDIPTSAQNLPHQFAFNIDFWAKNRADLQRRWDSWRLQ